MKAMEIYSPVPIQGMKEATLPNLNKEIEGTSFLELIQQKMNHLSKSSNEEDKTETLELMEELLAQLDSLLISFNHVEQNSEMKRLQTDLQNLATEIQQGVKSLKPDNQELQSFLEKAKLILQQADETRDKLSITSENQQKWGLALLKAFKQMDEVEKGLRLMWGKEQQIGVLSFKPLQQQSSLASLEAIINPFSKQLPSNFITVDKLKNVQLENQISTEKLILKAVPAESILPQQMNNEENTLLRIEPNSSSQQPVLQTSAPYLSAVNQQHRNIPTIQENKVPVQQLIRYVEPLFLTRMDSKAGHSIQKLILQLQPDSLGKLDVYIQSHNGQITAQFMVENATAKQVVEEQITQLRQSLFSQGVTVNSLEVIETSANNYQLFQHQQKQQQEQHPPFHSKGKKGKEYIEFEEDLKGQRDFIQHSMNTGINYIV